MREIKLEDDPHLPGRTEPAPYDYVLLVDEVEAGEFRCESYGVKIACPRTGEEARVEHITIRAERIEELCALLIRNSVSPVHLRDVVDDWL